MPTYYTPRDYDDYMGFPKDPKEHEFDSDAEARKVLLPWGAKDVYRMSGEIQVYIVKDYEAIPPTYYHTVTLEIPYPEI